MRAAVGPRARVAMSVERARADARSDRARARPRATADALEDLRVRCAHCDAVFAPRALEYGADARRFASETLRDAFDALERDEETNGFLLRGRERGDAAHRGLARACDELRKTMSLTEANATLGRGAMHVFSTKQARALLTSAGAVGEGEGRLRWFLDVGAGCGEVTETLAKNFEKTCATESSRGMAKRLRERGFDVVLESDTIEDVVGDVRRLGEDLDEDGFDVVAALNLCDRIDAPVTLMSQLKRALKPGTGVLILAIVVPFRPFVEGADGTRTKPSETVDAPSSGSWEAGVEALWENLIAPAGFELIRLARVPYISEGDHLFDAYVLDDAVFVLRAPAR